MMYHLFHNSMWKVVRIAKTSDCKISWRVFLQGTSIIRLIHENVIDFESKICLNFCLTFCYLCEKNANFKHSHFGCKYLFETDILPYMNLYRAKKLFGRDISLYMNLHRAKKMFGRDIFLYMNLYRAKKVDEQFLANKQTKRTEVGTSQI